MKTIYRIAIALMLLLVLSQCAKKSCHTCTQQCASVGVIDINNGGQLIFTQTFCGSSTAMAAWKSGINTAYASYSISYVAPTTTTKSFCGTDAQNNDSIIVYTAANYGCQ